jgi:hypothetical protein
MSGLYPVGIEVAPGERLARWRPLVNWLVALPLLLWLHVVSYGAVAVVVAAWFAIVFTGRMPGSLGDYMVGVLRYGWRVCAFLFGLTDRYPGFRLVGGYVDPADHPAVFYSAQPLVRNRLAVLFRLVLILPALLVFFPIALVLVSLLLAGWLSVLVLGRWPLVLRRTVVGCFGWGLRLASYGWLIVDAFPPVGVDVDPIAPVDARVLGRVQPDPREVTGPPWPRLIGAETYQPPRLPRWPIAVSAVLFAFYIASAAIGGLSAGRPGPSSSELATSSTSTFTLPPSPPPSPASLAIIQHLEAQVIAAPAGYTAGPAVLYLEGLMSIGAFEQIALDTGASDTGFLGGYEATYESDGGDSFIDIQLLRFLTPQDAGYFRNSPSVFPQDDPSEQSAFPAIPAAIVITGIETSEPSRHDFVVAATKGPVAMVVDVNSASSAAPAHLAAWAEQQYKRLQ